jgi:hypothetical protein
MNIGIGWWILGAIEGIIIIFAVVVGGGRR